jgi:uncharacterized protein YjbI with pentapeptide repeats
MKSLIISSVAFLVILRSGSVGFGAQDFSGQDLSKGNYKDGALNGANFSDTNLEFANFTNATLKKANFRGSKAKSANFSRANLDDADFTGADLRGATFTDARAWNAKFSGAEIHLAVTPDFSHVNDNNGARTLLLANFDKSVGTLSFHYADMRNTLILGNAYGVDFRGADLCGADLSKLENLDKARLKGAKYNKNTQWKINPEQAGVVLVEAVPADGDPSATKSPFSGKWTILKGEEGATDNGVLQVFSNKTFEWNPTLSADVPKVLNGKWKEVGEQIELQSGELGQNWSASRVIKNGKVEIHLKSEKGVKRIALQ